MSQNAEMDKELPVAKIVVREPTFLDVQLRPEASNDLAELGLGIGDAVAFSSPLLQPDPFVFKIESVGGKGLLSVRPCGSLGEEGRICTRRLLEGSNYTIIRQHPPGEFTVHRHVSIVDATRLQLHFAHGAQLNKLNLRPGSDLKVKEKPCGVEEWEVVETHTENLDKCPNCRSGLKGPRPKDFNASDLCAPGTQYVIVQPKQPGPRGTIFHAEGSLMENTVLRLVTRAEKKSKEPEPASRIRLTEGAPRRRSPPRFRGRSDLEPPLLRSRSRGAGSSIKRLRSRSRTAPGITFKERLSSRSRGKDAVRRRSRTRDAERGGSTHQSVSSRYANLVNRSGHRPDKNPPRHEPPSRPHSSHSQNGTAPSVRRRSPPTRSAQRPRSERASRRRSRSAPRSGRPRSRHRSTERLPPRNERSTANHSGHTQWEPPAHPVDIDWERIEENGAAYYYDPVSGATQLEPPSVAQPPRNHDDVVGAGGGEDEWELLEDENGDPYYFHTISGDMRWDEPPGLEKSKRVGGNLDTTNGFLTTGQGGRKTIDRLLALSSTGGHRNGGY